MGDRLLVIGGAGDLGRKRILPALGEMGYQADVVDPRGLGSALPPNVIAHYCSLDSVPAPGDYLGVIVATPNNLHLRHSRWAVETARRPCLVEKPIAHTLKDAEQVVGLARTAQAQLWVADHYLAKPASRFLTGHRSELVASIGPVREVRGRILEDPGTLLGREWLRNPERSGGGVWIDTGFHLASVLLTLMPGRDWRFIRAEAAGYDPAHPDRAETAFEASAESGGMIVTLSVGKSHGVVGKDLQIEGDKGSVLVDWLSESVRCDGRVVFGPSDCPYGGYLALLDGFTRDCRDSSGRSSASEGLMTPEAALRALRMVMEAYSLADLPFSTRELCRH